jgi:radical SAM-linked protein
MALAEPLSPTPSPAEPGSVAVRDKVRIRFAKTGDLRLVSHHDLMQCFERMLRRAALPFHATEGFNPKPRMAFALSLALGIVGREEVVELELDEQLPPEEIHARLSRQAPPGLEINSVRRIDRKLRARVRRVCYRLSVPAEYRLGLPERLRALLAAPACWVQRTRPEARRLDIRPYLRDLRLGDGGLEMDFWVTAGGTARPDEVAALLGLGDLLEAGAVLERATLELCDEVGADVPDLQIVKGPDQPGGAETPRRPAPTALVPGPLSFES